MYRHAAIIIALAITIGAAAFTPSLAHPGRTDSSGGHNCRVGDCAGTYHYHNGGGTPAPAPVYTPPVYTPPAVVTPAPTPAPIPAPKPTPKAIQQMRELRNQTTSMSLLWVDLIQQTVNVPATSTAYVTIEPLTEAKKRMTGATEEPKIVADNSYYYVKSIVDGDTIKVAKDNTIQTVRLLGIDTPETKDPRKPVQCFGREATNHITSLALGKYVRLESDSTQGDKDRYNRLLRYVYLDDGTNINAAMVKDGFASAYVRYPVKQIEEYKRLQNEARAAGIGLWSAC